MKTIDELRKGFEETKTWVKCKSLGIAFDEKNKVYYSLNPIYISDSIATNAAWFMYQELNK